MIVEVRAAIAPALVALALLLSPARVRAQQPSDGEGPSEADLDAARAAREAGSAYASGDTAGDPAGFARCCQGDPRASRATVELFGEAEAAGDGVEASGFSTTRRACA